MTPIIIINTLMKYIRIWYIFLLNIWALFLAFLLNIFQTLKGFYEIYNVVCLEYPLSR